MVIAQHVDNSYRALLTTICYTTPQSIVCTRTHKRQKITSFLCLEMPELRVCVWAHCSGGEMMNELTL